MFITTELTSQEITSDNPVHQRLVFAYAHTAPLLVGNVLEVGCGFGRGLEWLLQYAKDYTAIDKNKKLIDELQIKYPKSNFIPKNIPPFEGIADNSFDTLVSFQVIEHIQNDDLFVKEIHRVLRPGGKAYITTPNRLWSLTRNPWHIREYLPSELENLGKKYFQQVEMKGVQGNEKVMEYYYQNKKSVANITKWDFFGLQYTLPRQILQIPYDFLNRLNRKKLQKQNTGLVNQIDYTDYSISTQAIDALDLYCILTK
jgi:2-polyprenyl-3-methyl-5-hydroxy-6-metoxy-1,4-benzoquinol methylase